MTWNYFSDLLIWQKAMDLTDEIYILVKHLPGSETFCLSDQMRRAAISIPSNIAEGHARQSNKDFKKFLYIAKGSTSELHTQILICIRQKYITSLQAKKALKLCDEVHRMLYSFIKSIEP